MNNNYISVVYINHITCIYMCKILLYYIKILIIVINNLNFVKINISDKFFIDLTNPDLKFDENIDMSITEY